MSTALCIISDGIWIAQAVNVCRQIREQGSSERICLLLLDCLPVSHYSKLSDLEVEIRVCDKQCWPTALPKTGIKLWLPKFFPAEEYVLLDSDLIILSGEFFDAFMPVSGRMKLVRESALTWCAGKKGVSDEQHTSIVGQPVLQTGIMSFDRTFWNAHIQEIFNRIQSDSSEYGDMVAVNQFMADNPDFLEPLPEEFCLVLRPNGMGPSTRVHLPRISVKRGELFYDRKPILSLHYTNSKGKICSYQDILRMVVRNERLS